MEDRKCWCGHEEEDHREHFKTIWENPHDMTQVIGCRLCGHDHEYDPDYGGFLQTGVQFINGVLNG